jgi:hypothetical protein
MGNLAPSKHGKRGCQPARDLAARAARLKRREGA